MVNLLAALHEDQARARATAVYRVQAMTSPDVVCVMLAGSGPLKVEQDFTGNASTLQTAIENLNPAGDSTEPSAALRLANIETAAKMLAAFPRKKMLLYFSTSIAEAADQNQAALQSALKAAMRANVAIFPIDVRPVAASKELSELDKYIDQVESAISQLVAQYGDKYAPVAQQQRQLDDLKLKRQTVALQLQTHAAATPAGVSPAEYNRRLAYAETTFGSATKNAMGRSYVRYGPPDQIETPTPSTKIWRYNYLDDFHGGAAFEFSGQFGARVLYPPPIATFDGQSGSPVQLAPLADALAREKSTSVNPATTEIVPHLPGRHVSIQIGTVAPGMPPSPNGVFNAAVAVPLDSLSGTVDILAQVRARSDSGVPGAVAGNLRDTPDISSGIYHSGFNLKSGAWTLNLIVRERATGRIFGETIDFDIK